MILGFFLLLSVGCSNEPCNGAIESVVLFSKPDNSFGGERIFVDVKNKGGLGTRKTLTLPNNEEATFQNVVIINDFRSRFKGRRKICFNEYYTMTATDYANINSEHLPEIELYR
jgi:hypothetical protein